MKSFLVRHKRMPNICSAAVLFVCLHFALRTLLRFVLLTCDRSKLPPKLFNNVHVFGECRRRLHNSTFSVASLTIRHGASGQDQFIIYGQTFLGHPHGHVKSLLCYFHAPHPNSIHKIIHDRGKAPHMCGSHNTDIMFNLMHCHGPTPSNVDGNGMQFRS